MPKKHPIRTTSKASNTARDPKTAALIEIRRSVVQPLRDLEKVQQCGNSLDSMELAWRLGASLAENDRFLYGALTEIGSGSSTAESLRKYRRMAASVSESDLVKIRSACEKDGAKRWGPSFLFEYSRLPSKGRLSLARKAISAGWGLKEWRRFVRIQLRRDSSGDGEAIDRHPGRRRKFDWNSREQVIDTLTQLTTPLIRFAESATDQAKSGTRSLKAKEMKALREVCKQVSEFIELIGE